MYDQSDCEQRMRRIFLEEVVFLRANMSACEASDMCWHVLLDGRDPCSGAGTAYERSA